MKVTEKELLLYQILEKKGEEKEKALNALLRFNCNLDYHISKMEMAERVFESRDVSRINSMREAMKRNEEEAKKLSDEISDIENKKYEIWKKIEEGL